MNQLTLPRLGGWVWLKIERMTLLFKVLKLLDTSCVVIQLLMMIVNRIMLIYRINYDPWDKEIHYWNLHRTTPLYIIGLSILLHFVITFHIILRDIISRDVVKLKSRVRRLSWSVLNWFIYYSCFTTHFSCRKFLYNLKLSVNTSRHGERKSDWRNRPRTKPLYSGWSQYHRIVHANPRELFSKVTRC